MCNAHVGMLVNTVDLTMLASFTTSFAFAYCRINKKNSQKDVEQKKSGNYFFYDDGADDDDEGDIDDSDI
jgi:hypothetical protein